MSGAPSSNSNAQTAGPADRQTMEDIGDFIVSMIEAARTHAVGARRRRRHKLEQQLRRPSARAHRQRSVSAISCILGSISGDVCASSMNDREAVDLHKRQQELVERGGQFVPRGDRKTSACEVGAGDDAEIDEDRLEQILERDKRVGDKRRERAAIDPIEERAAQHRLAGTGVPREHGQAVAPEDRHVQLLRRAIVFDAVIEKLGVRRGTKRLFPQAIKRLMPSPALAADGAGSASVEPWLAEESVVLPGTRAADPIADGGGKSSSSGRRGDVAPAGKSWRRDGATLTVED